MGVLSNHLGWQNLKGWSLRPDIYFGVEHSVTWFFGPIYGSGPAQRRRARGLGRAPGLQGCATGGPSPPGGCRRVGRAVDAGAGARVLVRRDPAGAGRIGLARATPGRATGPACGGQAME